jgi:hypothetical protein
MTQFHNVNSITTKDKISILEDNLKGFLDWSFLNIGGFVNVNIPTSGITGVVGFHSLQKSPDPTVNGNKLWESQRKDWVYESGISYSGMSPIRFSGLYLNGTFLSGPSGSGNYGYSVNYPLGQVLFDNAVSSTSKVSASYSYRYVQVYKASDSFWWKELQKDTYNPANYKPNGDFSISSIHRIQMPCVMIELSPRVELKPYQLGTTQNIWKQEIFLHIFAQTASQRNILLDILLAQKDKVLYLYDSNKVAQNQVYSLNKYGNINPSGYKYPDLTTNFRHSWCTISNSSVGEINSLSNSLYNAIMKWSIEIFP